MNVDAREGLSCKETTKLFPVNSIGEILVGVRSRNDEKRSCQLDFIGGGAQPKDRCPLKTGVREAKEEVGLILQPRNLRYVDVTMSPSGNSLVTYYAVQVADDFVPMLEDGELEDAFFQHPEYIYQDLEHDGQREMLAAYVCQAYDLRQLIAA